MTMEQHAANTVPECTVTHPGKSHGLNYPTAMLVFSLGFLVLAGISFVLFAMVVLIPLVWVALPPVAYYLAYVHVMPLLGKPMVIAVAVVGMVVYNALTFWPMKRLTAGTWNFILNL